MHCVADHGTQWLNGFLLTAAAKASPIRLFFRVFRVSLIGHLCWRFPCLALPPASEPTSCMQTGQCAWLIQYADPSSGLQAVPFAVLCLLLCCAVLCCAVLCCAVLCCAVLCCAVLCCAVLCCAVL